LYSILFSIALVLCLGGLIGASGCSDSKSSETPNKEPLPPATADKKPDTKPDRKSEPAHTKYPDVGTAVSALLARRPRVVGFGEYHATKGGPNVVPSLTRFRTQVLPAITGVLGDIVVETWVEPSGCGENATKAGEEVKVAMERPEETETEVFTLLREARERKLGAHILEMSCADYASFRSAGTVDYDKPLSIVTARLLAGIEKTVKAGGPATIAVYGGTMHNDVHPTKGFGAYSYAPKVSELTKNKYLEIDLFVPELIADSSLFKGQPWFDVAKKLASPDHVVVIERSPASYVVMLKRGVTSKASP